MVEATLRSPEAVENESVESAERWLALIASIEREAFFARTLTFLGGGALGAALLILAVTTRWRFTLRILLFVMLYIAVIIGVPLGFVRPRLQNPQLSMNPAGLVVGVGQLLPYATAKYEGDPWTSTGPVSRGGSTLIDKTSVLVALAAAILPLAVALSSATRHTKPLST